MSKPANRISKYRSYRYYHVMIVCDRSETVDVLSTNTTLDTWLHPATDKYGVKEVKTPSGVAGKYVVLINGSTDAEFVITNASWTSATAASATHSDKNASLAIEGSVDVSEPRGVVFMDTLVGISLKLGIDAANLVFAIKTFFVGYAYDEIRGDYVDYINDIEPIQFIVYDISGTYTEAGGSYNMQFVALTNGATRLPQYSKAAEGFSLVLSEGTNATLSNDIAKLEQKVQNNYNVHYDCIIKAVKAQASQLVSTTGGLNATSSEQDIVDRFCRVEYKITLDPRYATPDYTVTDEPQQYKNKGMCEEGVTVKSQPGTSIEDVIHHIMRKSLKVKAEMTEGDSAGVKYEYKIQSALKSTADPLDNTKVLYTITYFITKFAVPKGVSVEALLNTTNQNSDAALAVLRENVIEFDYLYSGKNIDILEFDIKMTMGLAFLQTATSSNAFKDQLETVPSRSTHLPGNAVTNLTTRLGKPTKIPLFFSTQIKAGIFNNTQDPKTTTESAYTLSKHSSLEVAEANVKIIGNYRLLNTINKSTSPSSIGLPPEPLESTTGSAEAEEANFRHWGYFPAFAKINIFMPRSNDDISFFEAKTGESYTRPFWYQGHYYVYGIKHSFDMGEFTQTLSMLALPDSSAFESTKQEQKLNLAATKMIEDCYDSKVGCGAPTTAGSTTTQTPIAEHAPRNAPDVAAEIKQNPKLAPAAGTSAPANKRDADTLNSLAGGPEDVKNWEQASAETQQAILASARKYKIRPKTLAQIAWIESKFKPDARAPKSTASGLFQHINKTWLTLVKQGSISSVPSSTPTAPALDKRFNPTASAEGGAVLLIENQIAIGSQLPGDIYLAHFLGAPRAKKVIFASNSGLGDRPMSVVLTPKAANSIAKANPGVPTGTPNELREYAAKKMAQSLKGGVPTTTPLPPVVQPASVNRRQSLSAGLPEKSKAGRTSAQNMSAVTACPKKGTPDDKKPCGSGKEPSVERDSDDDATILQN